jgi:hypothetical protein
MSAYGESSRPETLPGMAALSQNRSISLTVD